MSGWAWLGVYCASVFAALAAAARGARRSGRGMNARELLAFVPDCVVLFRRLAADPEVPRARSACSARRPSTSCCRST